MFLFERIIESCATLLDRDVNEAENVCGIHERKTKATAEESVIISLSFECRELVCRC